MRSLSFFLIGAATCLLTGVDAAGAATRTPTLGELRAANKDLAEFYGDVGSRLACGKPRSEAEKIVCSDPYLIEAALLSARAQVYGYENATKTVLDHRTFKAKFPSQCKDRACILDFFADQIEAGEGVNSPFDVDWLGRR